MVGRSDTVEGPHSTATPYHTPMRGRAGGSGVVVMVVAVVVVALGVAVVVVKVTVAW
jgi:hypothetical protein